MKMNSPRPEQKNEKEPKRNKIYNNIKNIPIRLDKESLVCYTKSVAGACVQAFGTFGTASDLS